jgi:chloramphenicol-sensitive protein RarD
MASDPTPPAATPADERARGLAFAFAAYGAWGFFPLYFKALDRTPALEVLAHRVAWSAAVLTLLVAATGRRRALVAALRSGATVRALAVTTGLIAFNWGTYVWAVNAGRIVEASLGYFVNPLVNVLLGALFLGETLSRPTRWAVGIAGAGVLVLTIHAGALPWIPLALAASFGLYGLLRKRAAVDAVTGLLVETLLLLPLALGWLALLDARGAGAFGHGARLSALLAAAGPITAFPLVWFGLAIRRLRLSTVGFVQYVTPTTQLLLAVLRYGEPFDRAHAVAFGLIWSSLGIYTVEALRRQRRPAA